MTKRTAIVIAAVIAAALALAFVAQPELFTAAGRQARFLRSLERGPLVVRRNCQSMETFVQGSYWQSMRDSDREQAGRLLAEYCREQGSSGQMTIVDAESKQKLAHWDGSALQKF
jgi:hypothetical protein